MGISKIKKLYALSNIRILKSVSVTATHLFYCEIYLFPCTVIFCFNDICSALLVASFYVAQRNVDQKENRMDCIA
jgi:hypothetical protein